MALIKCPECGKEVSDHAISCPGCGYPLHEDTSTKEAETTSVEIPRKNNTKTDTIEQPISKKKISKKALIGVCAIIVICISSAVLFMQGFILTGDDKAVYDLIVSCEDSFKNPASVRIVSGTYDNGDLFARISAKNGFGATTTDAYMISDGFLQQDDSGTSKSVYEATGDFHINLINRALSRKFK